MAIVSFCNIGWYRYNGPPDLVRQAKQLIPGEFLCLQINRLHQQPRLLPYDQFLVVFVGGMGRVPPWKKQ